MEIIIYKETSEKKIGKISSKIEIFFSLYFLSEFEIEIWAYVLDDLKKKNCEKSKC